MVTSNPNVGIAFGLVFVAGAATSLGSAVVFFPKFVKFVSPRFLAGSLGLSAGVMLYNSFVEIFSKSLLAFSETEIDQDLAYVYSTLSFFSGVTTIYVLDVVVALITGRKDDEESSLADIRIYHESVNPLAEIQHWQSMAERELNGQEHELRRQQTELVADGDGGDVFSDAADDRQTSNNDEENNRVGSSDNRSNSTHPMMCSKSDQKKLAKMGLDTALVIGLHNFPEGLITFVATLADARVGAVLAVAISIHNIPEGLCVSLPIYFATGNRMKAFLWGSLSGIFEPVAAFFGWLVLASVVTPTVYAVLFGWISGMMVMICVKEILPTAFRYDPKDTVVTHSVVAGMAVIALSLVLFAVN
mmetsp:Transcript_12761/g.26779  ORF Transcript_12761/g.26779 Transcript_12761/m.26779 type:complete len:360 (+) Transcript_12761:162-1241(+)